MENTRLSHLQTLGLTQYEAEVYLALLQEYPANGSQVARRSGVPRSMVYQTLDRLLEKGAVLLAPGDPALYAPVPPREFIGRRQAVYGAACEHLLQTLPARAGGPADLLAWNLQGREAIQARAEALARSAGPRLLTGGAPAVLAEYLPQLYVLRPAGAAAAAPAPGLPPGAAVAVLPGAEALLVWVPAGATPVAVHTRQPAAVAAAAALARQHPAVRRATRPAVPDTWPSW